MASLHAVHGHGTNSASVATALCIVANVALNIYSDVGLSAQILQGKQELVHLRAPAQRARHWRRQLDEVALPSPPAYRADADRMSISPCCCGTDTRFIDVRGQRCRLCERKRQVQRHAT